MLVPELPLRLLWVAGRELDRRHLAERPRHRLEEALDQLVAPRADIVPSPLLLELDRRRHGQPRRRVARALPPVPCRESVLRPAPAHDQRVDPLLQLFAHPEEPGALGSAEPLVTVA